MTDDAPYRLRFVRWLMPASVGLLALAVFFPVLQNRFVDWDDDVNILDNPYYRGLGWRQLRWMFTNLDMGHYQPLSWITLGLDYLSWGMNPFGYHLTNLFLHGANAVIFYFVALRLLAAAFREPMAGRELSLRIAAGFAALLFAIHPLRVESVAWVTERRGLLAGLFFLSSILCYLRANLVTEEGGAARRRWMAAAVGTFGCSLLSKASGLALPVVLLVLDVYPLARLSGGARSWLDGRSRKVFWEKIPFIVLALAALAAAFLAERQRGAVRRLDEFGMILRLGQVFFGLTFYLWKTFVPVGLYPIYSVVADAVPAYWPIQPREEMILALFIAVALTVSVALFIVRKRWPAGLGNWICYAAILAPVLGIIRVGEQIAADRYSYLSCLGLALLAGGGAVYFCSPRVEGQCSSRRVVGTAVLGMAILTGLGFLSWRQTRVWHDSETLFAHVLLVSPDSKIAHVNLGVVLAERGKLDEAVEHYRETLRIDPNFPLALVDLADALVRQGKLEEAVSLYRRFVRLNHSFYNLRLVAYNRLGLVLIQQGKLEEAAETYRQAIAIEPGFEEAHNNLGLILARQGKLDEAFGHYRKALDSNPGFAPAHVNLGDALVLTGELDEAIAHFRKALAIEPGSASAARNLERALAERDRKGRAN